MNDRLVVRMVVAFLGIAGVAALGIAGLLSYQSKSVPDAVIALGSAGFGALAGLLAKTSSEPDT